MVDMFLFCLFSKLDGFNKFTIPFLVIPSPTLGSVELVRFMINSAMAFTCYICYLCFGMGSRCMIHFPKSSLQKRFRSPGIL